MIATLYQDLEPGRLATVYAVTLEDHDENKNYTDYKLSDCIELDIIFNSSNMPCYYTIDDENGYYVIGYDIYEVLIPIAFKTIGRIIKGVHDE